jgi:putative ABC transport system ATP-binding protein
MLDRVGLAGKENSRPGNLSGGEQQRVAIARALAKGARILYADEPTGSLDSATGGTIMELLRALNRDGMTIVMVTHNPDYARQAHASITMVDGRICCNAGAGGA